jgi:hypothetical protein
MPEPSVQADQAEKYACRLGTGVSSEINTAQGAIGFVNSLDPETRAKLHWRVAASVLSGLAAGQGSFDQAGRALRHALAEEGWLVE